MLRAKKLSTTTIHSGIHTRLFCTTSQKKAIPVIDAHLYTGSSANKTRFCNEIRSAASNIGFMYIKNSPLSERMIDASVKQAEHFFKLPDCIKNSCRVTQNNSKGYYIYQGVGIGEINIGYMKGSSKDSIEAFLIGNDQPHYFKLKKDYYEKCVNDATDSWKSFFPPNQWPSLPDFKKQVLECYQACSTTSTILLEAISLSLGLPSDYFAKLHSKTDHQLELKHYPPLDSKQAEDVPWTQQLTNESKYLSNTSTGEDNLDNDGTFVRVKTHADLSSVTLLMQNDVDGLQVHTKEGWIDAPYLPNCVLVNTGDCMQRFTGGLFKSTKHRVIYTPSNKKQSRYSVVYFCTPDWDARVSVIPTLASSASSDDAPFFGDMTPFL